MMALTMWVSCAARTNYDFGYNQEERVMGPYLRPIAPNSAFSSIIGYMDGGIQVADQWVVTMISC